MAEENSTIFGYDVRELAVFALACRNAGIENEDLKASANSCEFAWDMMQSEWERTVKEALEGIIKGSE